MHSLVNSVPLYFLFIFVWSTVFVPVCFIQIHDLEDQLDDIRRELQLEVETVAQLRESLQEERKRAGDLQQGMMELELQKVKLSVKNEGLTKEQTAMEKTLAEVRFLVCFLWLQSEGASIQSHLLTGRTLIQWASTFFFALVSPHFLRVANPSFQVRVDLEKETARCQDLEVEVQTLKKQGKEMRKDVSETRSQK